MEALTAASVAALTVYDMCKAVDRGMVISDVRLLHKSGGKSGTYNAYAHLRARIRVERSAHARDALRLGVMRCERSMLTVRDAHARVIAAFDALPAEMVSVADAAGRVLAVVAAGAPHPAAGRPLGDGRLRRARRGRAGRADDAQAGRPGAGRRLLRSRAEARRDRAHLHRRPAADGRRRHRHPGRHQGRRRPDHHPRGAAHRPPHPQGRARLHAPATRPSRPAARSPRATWRWPRR